LTDWALSKPEKERKKSIWDWRKVSIRFEGKLAVKSQVLCKALEDFEESLGLSVSASTWVRKPLFFPESAGNS